MMTRKLRALHDRLIESGCNPRLISIAGTPNDHKDDNFRLASEFDGWSIRYWERGQSHPPEFITDDLDIAIAEYEQRLAPNITVEI